MGTAAFTPDVAVAAASLRRGGIVAYPTETFYGLGALATLPAAVARLGDAKLRPEGKPLPLVAADERMAFGLWAGVPPGALVLARAFWPGPLTLVAALGRELCRLAGGPLVSTSANPSGGPPPVDAGGLDPWLLARIDLVLDGGRTPGGLPSTVVEVGAGAPRLLRAGAVPWEAVEGALRSPLPSRGG
jgi:L-threonylcarbamoyladenylate synthase